MATKVSQLVQYKVYLRRIGDAKDQEVHRFFYFTHNNDNALPDFKQKIQQRSPYLQARPHLKLSILWLDGEKDHVMIPDSSALVVAAEDCLQRKELCKMIIYVPREASN